MAPNALPSVGYLGPPSSYSHQAALETFDTAAYRFAPQTTIAGTTFPLSRPLCPGP